MAESLENLDPFPAARVCDAGLRGLTAATKVVAGLTERRSPPGPSAPPFWCHASGPAYGAGGGTTTRAVTGEVERGR